MDAPQVDSTLRYDYYRSTCHRILSSNTDFFKKYEMINCQCLADWTGFQNRGSAIKSETGVSINGIIFSPISGEQTRKGNFPLRWPSFHHDVLVGGYSISTIDPEGISRLAAYASLK